MINSSIVFLPVNDINRTYRFYHEILGLPVFQKQGENLYIFDTGYGYWGFCQYDDDRAPLSGNKGVCLSLNLNDNEEVLSRYEELKDKVEIYKKPSRHPVFPVYSFFIYDPDHYLVEFQKISS
ncbi:MAG: VOC family protein [Erysipelotrichaceae bacterium]|nr:VOC family protein [Erysipelotrichaceae bacterium]